MLKGESRQPPVAGGPQSANKVILEMEQLVEQIQGAEWQYAWLPTGAVQALVYWLAATILRPPGRFPQAMSYFCQGQQAIDEELKRHHIGVQVLFSPPLPCSMTVACTHCSCFPPPPCPMFTCSACFGCCSRCVDCTLA